MPLYDFQCQNEKCGKVEEYLLGLSDRLPASCSQCGGKLKKLISVPHVDNKNIPAWEKHSDFVRKLKPKYVKDGRTGERKRLR